MSTVKFTEIFHLPTIEKFPNRRQEFELIFYLLSTYHFRICEVLSLSISSLVGPHMIIVKLAKCKEYYVIYDYQLFVVLMKLFRENPYNKFSVTYKQFYEWMKSEKPSYCIFTNTGYSHITHSFRYKHTELLQSALKNDYQIKALLRHNSLKSQKYYKSDLYLSKIK
jgi:hypothetical protein